MLQSVMSYVKSFSLVYMVHWCRATASVATKKKSETIMAERGENSHFETRLSDEIEALEVRIRQLRAEQDALRRQLLKSRTIGKTPVHLPRSDSLNRAMTERTVLDLLDSEGGPVRTRILFKKTSYLVPELREGTFRTNLNRMKEKGLIEGAGHGWWRKIRSTRTAG